LVKVLMHHVGELRKVSLCAGGEVAYSHIMCIASSLLEKGFENETRCGTWLEIICNGM
jgi:hypothetical protein